MTPDEAIETLQEGKDGTVEMLTAKRLGIEALERLKELRESYTEFSDIHIVIDHISALLPSETEGGE